MARKVYLVCCKDDKHDYNYKVWDVCSSKKGATIRTTYLQKKYPQYFFYFYDEEAQPLWLTEIFCKLREKPF